MTKLYGIFTKKGICMFINGAAGKMPLILANKKVAASIAAGRTKQYKRIHTVKPVKVTGTK